MGRYLKNKIKHIMNGKTVGLVAGISAAAFLGYCIYFDRKRRSAPDFKAKLRDKRRTAAKKGSSGSSSGPPLPDFSDQEAVQRFFLQEVQLGEQLLAQGDLEQGVEHLSLAVAVCGQPHSLLGVLQQTLPMNESVIESVENVLTPWKNIYSGCFFVLS